jgi:hypothetical protein
VTFHLSHVVLRHDPGLRAEIQGMKNRLFALIVFASCASMCDRPVSPCVPREWVVLSDSTRSGIRMIDVAGRCPDAQTGVGGSVEDWALDNNTKTAYLSVRGTDARRRLVSIDLRTTREVWRQELTETTQPGTIGGVLSGEVLAVSPDGKRLYAWRGIKDGVQGIRSLDLQARAPLGFSGPWNVVAGGLIPLPPNAAFSEGALVVIGLQEEPGPRRGRSRVYFLHPISLSLIDSIPPASIGGEEDIWQLLPAPDDRSVYIAGSSQFIRYDLVERRTLATAPRQGTGVLALMAAGDRLVVTDIGLWPDSPGSGVLRLYSSDLQSQGTIDVSSPLGGAPGSATATRTGFAAASYDGRKLYVRSGSEELGPLYPAQRARVLVVDVIERKLLDAIEIGGFGLGFILALPP